MTCCEENLQGGSKLVSGGGGGGGGETGSSGRKTLLVISLSKGGGQLSRCEYHSLPPLNETLRMETTESDNSQATSMPTFSCICTTAPTVMLLPKEGKENEQYAESFKMIITAPPSVTISSSKSDRHRTKSHNHRVHRRGKFAVDSGSCSKSMLPLIYGTKFHTKSLHLLSVV